MVTSPALLIALDAPEERERRARELRALGVECEPAPNLEAALAALEDGAFPALLNWESDSGSAALRSIVARHPDVRVLALAKEDVSIAVSAMRAGAWDVIAGSAESVVIQRAKGAGVQVIGSRLDVADSNIQQTLVINDWKDDPRRSGENGPRAGAAPARLSARHFHSPRVLARRSFGPESQFHAVRCHD